MSRPTDRDGGRRMPSPPTTLADLLLHRTESTPAMPAFTFLGDSESTLTYADVDRSARIVAAALAASDAARARVLLCLPPGPDSIAALFGCAYVGAVAVPAYPPDPSRPAATEPPLRALADDARPALAIARAVDGERLASLLPAATRILALEDALAATPLQDPTPTDGEAVALLVYTSGSTSSPKGVVVEHRNLLHNITAFEAFRHAVPTGFVSWVPPVHVVGLLFGILHPLFHGVRSVLMPPSAFVARPMRWLEAIDRFGASASAAPNWAYDLCVRAANGAECAALDLRSWTFALNGGEPVRRETLDRFAEAFGPAGFRREAFYPSYGSAEGVGTVSGGSGGHGFRSIPADRRALECGRLVESRHDGRDLVSCGRSLPDEEIRIVDPESRLPCGPGEIGEIWVAGPSVARGYWGRPAESAETFGARLADGTGPFLRTGDLGVLHDGELVITGRLKDVVVIHGRNLMAQDIELTATGAHPALDGQACAAFGLDVDGQERLAVVCEVAEPAPAAATTVIGALREAIADHHGVDLHLAVLVDRGGVPRTASGKIRRRECRRAHLVDELPVVAQWRGRLDAAEIPAPAPIASAEGRSAVAERAEDYLVSYFAHKLSVEPATVDRAAPFTRFGIASVEGVALAAALGSHISRPLPAMLLWEHPSIREVVAWLDEVDGAPAEARSERPADAAEPVAIVGLGCRFPGAPSPEDLWSLLEGRGSGITKVPPGRWSVGARLPAGRFGGFLQGLDRFDAAFFGISPREAPHVDPRQRLTLELSWEALEDAGIPPDSLAGSDTGVFIAVLSNDYDQLLFRDLSRVDAYSGPGTANSIVANRVSYALDLHGPSLVLDTACSGSLVAIHLACQSLRADESRVALAGGVSVNLLPHGDLFFAAAGALSPDGRCRTFDEGANGIVRAEGAGLVVLKRLSDAVQDGDRVYAVIRGSAVNSDGRTNGLMAPSRDAQEAVVRDAYRRAGVAPSNVQYVEVHGTGTPLGDPIELRALGAVLQEGRPADRRCAVGSVKTNLGHLEPAAGVAGVIKVALALYRELIPPTLHFERANPHISFEELPFVVADRAMPWRLDGSPRVAGVSGFGFGGTNAHLVLEGAPPTPAEPAPVDGPWVLPLSARSDAALALLAQAVADRLAGDDAQSVRDVCFTAARGRTHHDRRLAAVGATLKELRADLAARAAAPGPLCDDDRIVFMFGGQGTQWPEMAATLLEREPVFRDVVEKCEELHAAFGGRRFVGRLRAGEPITGTDVAQPAVFAMQAGLAALWSSYGVEPDAVVGQSLGEATAAYVCGALTLEQAVAVVHHRSRLMKRVEGQGRTAVVRLPFDEAARACAGGGAIAVAGRTGPRTTVIAGPAEPLARLLASLDRRGVPGRMVPGVEIAFHGPLMDALAPELMAALASLAPRRSRVPMVSTVTGREVAGEKLGASYWARNLREPFDVNAALGTLVTSGHRTFLELSPHEVMCGAATEIGQAAGATMAAISSMRRGVNPRATIASALADLYAGGRRIDWTGVYPTGRRVALPRYPWQRTRHWLEDLDGRTPAAVGEAWEPGRGGGHPLLGSHVALAQPAGRHVWTTRLATTTPRFLADHRLLGRAAVPAALYLDMALAAAAEVLARPVGELLDVRLQRALFLDETERTLQLIGDEGDEGTLSLTFFSREGDEAPWVEHAACVVRPRDEDTPPAAEVCPELDPGAVEEGGRHYDRMLARGLGYGPCFRAVERLAARDHDAVARLRLPAELALDASGYVLHPVLIDASFQTIAAAGGDRGADALYVPVAVRRARVWPTRDDALWCRAQVRPVDAGDLEADVSLHADDGRVVARIDGLRLRALPRDAAADTRPRPALGVQEVAWRAADPPPRPAAARDGGGRWLVLEDAGGVGRHLAALLAESGGECSLIAGDRTGELPGMVLERALGPAPWDGVVDLRGLQAPPLDGSTAQEQLVAVRRALDPLMVLADAPRSAGNAASPRVWVVTRGAQATARGAADPAAAALWGMGRVLANENPRLWGGLIDLDEGGSPDRDARLVLGALTDPGDDDQIALHDGRRLVPRLTTVAAELDEPLIELHSDGAYLVTGGFGGLGTEVSRFLTDRGARRLVLVSRSGDVTSGNGRSGEAARRAAAVRALEARGATVEVAAVDVADETALAELVRTREAAALPPISGVFHAAGVTRDKLMSKLDGDDVDAVLRSKVGGAWALHRVLGDVRYFVLFSSVSSVLGPIGQGPYAAANAYLDALAHFRRERGLAATSISWGPWADIGMMAGRAASEGDGIEGMSVAEGLRALSWILRHQPAHVTVVRADWERVAARAERPVPLLTPLLSGGSAALAAITATPILQRLLLMPEEERRAELETLMRDLAAHVMRLPASQLDVRKPLNALGMDSIMAVELRHQVEATVGLTFSIVELLEGAGILTLAASLVSQLPTDDTVGRLLDEIERLSDDDVRALLAQKESPP